MLAPEQMVLSICINSSGYIVKLIKGSPVIFVSYKVSVSLNKFLSGFVQPIKGSINHPACLQFRNIAFQVSKGYFRVR